MIINGVEYDIQIVNEYDSFHDFCRDTEKVKESFHNGSLLVHSVKINSYHVLFIWDNEECKWCELEDFIEMKNDNCLVDDCDLELKEDILAIIGKFKFDNHARPMLERIKNIVEMLLEEIEE